MIEIKRRQPAQKADFPDTMPPLLQRIYANRGAFEQSSLERSSKALLSYTELYGIEKAVHLLADTLDKGRRIIIVGDFDADGATSCALAVSALSMMGCTQVDYLVPNRFEDGYGLSPDVVDQAIAKGAQLIITVDNGVSSIEGVAAAKAKGLDVLVTDHHLPGDTLPDADAMVNPNLKECGFPSKSLAGVGVAFYLMLALRAHLQKKGWFEARGIAYPNLGILLDLVALGTVADVVSLDFNNRILVHQGLMRVRAGKCRPGIQALIEVARRNMKTLVASDFGFAIAPRINAAGRLDDMSFGVELLLCEDLPAARKMAIELDALNETRKEIEQGMKEEGMAICEKLQFGEKTSLPMGIALLQKEWHQGVVGILASRIKDKFHRPVIAFAGGGDGLIKGSARSILGLHIRDILDVINTRNPGLIKKFGGHAMAAGLTLEEVDFERFSRLFDEAVKENITEDALKEVLLSDGELLPVEMNLDVAHMLREGGPWGQGFPEPLFDGKFKLLNQKLVAGKHLKMLIEPEKGGQMIDAIAFNIDLKRWPDPCVQMIEIVYRLDVNEFRGNCTLQLMVEHIVAC